MVSETDLIYGKPASRLVEGHPIGNGRMGMLVWTTPDALQFQINRVDVFAVNRNAAGARFPGRKHRLWLERWRPASLHLRG
ncbi:MAG: glycoside hydrolase family 95 protein [Verrucomicrobia bacterium]|nr:glycoside hydrolase family 95 protein [Verrucomicrobiota bacterium]MBU4367055.1 glycoside hydrolase family 95 protein [Verrucomicrobiota bacterium]